MFRKQVAIFGGSFDPPGLHHIAIVKNLATKFDKVIVVPCGPRPDKETVSLIEPIHRAAMADLAFGHIPGVQVDLFDLEQSQFTRTWDLQSRYADEGVLCHVVGSDLTMGGAKGKSQIESFWYQGDVIWEVLNFVVQERQGYPIVEEDLPPNSKVIKPPTKGSSTEIRKLVFSGCSIQHLTTTKVARYISRHGLYRGASSFAVKRIRLEDPRPFIVTADNTNIAAHGLSNLAHNQSEANCILAVGGDGTMLHAIRKYWRKRLPFIGLNTGHRGYLLNDPPPEENAAKWIRSVLKRELTVVHAPLLYVEADGKRACAFNDAWVERTSGQTARLKVSVNGQVRISNLVADGILAATAAGSTAYAGAMGAKPLPVGAPVITLVGNNIMSPKWKLAHLPMDSEIVIETLEPQKRPVKAYVDGINLGLVTKFTVRVSRIAAVELAFVPERDMAAKLASVQFPEEPS